MKDKSYMETIHDHKREMEALQELPDAEQLRRLGRLFAVIGDPTRVKLLYTISKSDICVSALCVALNMEQSAVSHQLRILRDAKLLGCRREGKTMVYFIADDHVRKILKMAQEHLAEEGEEK